MEPKLTLRIANSDLLPVQGRYEELLNAPDMGGALTAWRGDTAIALLVLLSGNERVEGAAACAQPFENGENRIPPETVSCTFLSETKAFVGNGKKDNGSRESFPDVLYGPGPVSMEPGRVQGIFVSIAIPADAAPGVYRGAVSVTAEGLDTPLESSLRWKCSTWCSLLQRHTALISSSGNILTAWRSIMGLSRFPRRIWMRCARICSGIGRWGGTPSRQALWRSPGMGRPMAPIPPW